MQSFIENERACGILAHISSLPGPYGIGDIGSSSFKFIDFLSHAGQKYWQILPTVPTSLYFDSSPYMSTSAFADSPLLISPDSLHEMDLLDEKTLLNYPQFSPYSTDYPRVYKYKRQLLELCFKSFSANNDRHDSRYQSFISRTPWLNDYALFMCLKEVYENKPWSAWPDKLARRDPSALAEAEDRYRQQADYYLFEQYLFYKQWSALKQYARSKDIKLIGDIPIYVGLDSSDVWANQSIFEIDEKTLKPIRVSGVPPDYFSKTGQLWGNPLYRWNSKNTETESALLDWWLLRFKSVFAMVDIVRVDHFRGFETYWAVPADEETALNGEWIKGPGAQFFNKIYTQLGELNIIAEDLGEITPEVIKLRDNLGFPGMKVLQFAFDNTPENYFLPYNYKTSNCVVYTGTHDNDTSMGWFLSDQLSNEDRKRIKQFANRVMNDPSPINNDLIYLALSSIAALAIIPLQDVLGFGSDCRMNTPGVAEGNWRWRCHEKYLTSELADDFKRVVTRFGRILNNSS